MIENVVIIGGGPAGLSAAVYLARAGLKPLVFAGSPPGGQLTLTSEVENYPGFESILGSELVSKIRNQAIKFGARIVDENVIKVDFIMNPFKIYGKWKIGIETGQENRKKKIEINPTSTIQLPNSFPNPPSNFVSAKSVIIATGAKALWLNLPSETRLRGKGVSACATCDGFFFKNKTVAVIGGGDTALEEALTLTKFANKVYIIHRRDFFRASKIMQERVFANKKIEIIWNAAVEEIIGKKKVEGLRITVIPTKVEGSSLKDSSTNARNDKKILNLDGVFVAIGHKPDTDLFKGQVELDEKGYIKILERRSTSVKGVFVAGDCADPYYRQAATASGTGVEAALEVEKYLEQL